jgi:hypothetical protein
MMDMHSRNQYLKVLQTKYQLTSKKGKSKILDEYCQNTGQSRKYVIQKINSRYLLKKTGKRGRKQIYDGYVIAALVEVWKIFDYPCGDRLEPLLKTEVERLRAINELKISDEVAAKLKKISSATIDRRLAHEKEVLHLKKKYLFKKRPALYQIIPVRGNDWDRSVLGQIQIDLVEHCGQSASGEYICSLSVVDVASGWWEGRAVMGRGQRRTFKALTRARKQMPIPWREIHPDSDTAFINWHLLRYSQQENLIFSRSRPYQKNDNCFVEQKNSTHIRGLLGHLRYDTEYELMIINELYDTLRLYKNFFQPVIKLKEKVREKGRIHRKYDQAKTPYQRIIESDWISEEKRKELTDIYLSLNPAELKRYIDGLTTKLYHEYQAKKDSRKVEVDKKLHLNTVRFFMNRKMPVRLGSYMS